MTNVIERPFVSEGVLNNPLVQGLNMADANLLLCRKYKVNGGKGHVSGVAPLVCVGLIVYSTLQSKNNILVVF